MSFSNIMFLQLNLIGMVLLKNNSYSIRKHRGKCSPILPFIMSDLLRGIYNPIKLNMPPSIFNRLFYMMTLFLRKLQKDITFI